MTEVKQQAKGAVSGAADDQAEVQQEVRAAAQGLGAKRGREEHPAAGRGSLKAFRIEPVVGRKEHAKVEGNRDEGDLGCASVRAVGVVPEAESSTAVAAAEAQREALNLAPLDSIQKKQSPECQLPTFAAVTAQLHLPGSQANGAGAVAGSEAVAVPTLMFTAKMPYTKMEWNGI